VARQQRIDRRRVAGERVQDLMAARFDFAREHDFILALEQRHRMDTTHVERHRIGGRTAPRARSPSSARLSSSVSRSTSTGVVPTNGAGAAGSSSTSMPMSASAARTTSRASALSLSGGSASTRSACVDIPARRRARAAG
jgi:hypothetical protein